MRVISESEGMFGRMLGIAALLLAVIATGCVGTVPKLVGQDTVPVSSWNPVGSRADATLSASAVLEMQTNGMSGGVTSVNLLGEPVVLGAFDGGEIIKGEFKKFLSANFREPVGNETPVVKLTVKVLQITARQPMCSDTVKATIRVLVRLTNGAGDTVGYSRDFSASASGVWDDVRKIPPPFYAALGKVMTDFMADWNSSRTVETVSAWGVEMRPRRKTPALVSSVEWSRDPQGNVYHGRCEVDCNDYEGFEAKTWAAAQILAECRRKLGGIETERVRVVPDEKEKYDQDKKRWTLSFHAFARAEKVLSYDELTRSGFVAGDLGLMRMSADQASEKLKEFVISEMDAHAGVVRGKPVKGTADVRFGKVAMDKTYNLLTIDFKLVY